jgi:3-deoxy-manno-octulosonate cytidylyltransferase (CMP-KDO synthetase)
MTSDGTLVVLPARYQSTRFPGKPLAAIAGKPLIEWVYRRALAIGGVARVVVATDDDRIASAVRGFGGDVIMTSTDHRSGTDRVAEVSRPLPYDPVVNLQGDEPVFPPKLIEQMVTLMQDDPSIDIVTPCHPIEAEAEINDPNIVKVVADRAGCALYFSRAPIPSTSPSHAGKPVPQHMRHIGIYVFRRRSLLRFAELARTPLEVAESLDQLRALENGMKIRVVITDQPTLGVDVPEDIKRVEKALTTA